MSKSVRNRTIDGLERVRALIEERMPKQTFEHKLILGTWNILNFDDNRFGDGSCLPEALYFIAEVIAAFDIIAIQEVCLY